MGRRGIGLFSFEMGFMAWTELLVARMLVVTEGALWFEAVESDLTVWWCKGWGYMGMLMGGSAMVIAMDPSSYLEGKDIAILDNE